MFVELTSWDEELHQKEAKLNKKESLWANYLETKEYQELLRSKFLVDVKFAVQKLVKHDQLDINFLISKIFLLY